MFIKIKLIIAFVFFICVQNAVLAQCCAAGGGSPIAGGTSQGVLQEKQFEINANLQYLHSTQFYTKDTKDTNFFDSYSSSYTYTRLAYGLSEKLTLSVEAGYWMNKKEVKLNNIETLKSSGIGDLIVFPRYDVLNYTKNGIKTELTLGMGYKIPLGKYNDSIEKTEPFSGVKYKEAKPLTLQPSSGSHDFIFYAFFYKGFLSSDLSLFANAVYIKKGWNPLGEKIGDYARVGLFANKRLIDNLSLTMQVSAEWIDIMKINNDISMFVFSSYDPKATGSTKIFVTPQLSYAFKCNLTLYSLLDYPIYQYVNKTQIGSQWQATVGLSYKFKPFL